MEFKKVDYQKTHDLCMELRDFCAKEAKLLNIEEPIIMVTQQSTMTNIKRAIALRDVGERHLYGITTNTLTLQRGLALEDDDDPESYENLDWGFIFGERNRSSYSIYDLIDGIVYHYTDRNSALIKWLQILDDMNYRHDTLIQINFQRFCLDRNFTDYLETEK